MTGVQTCALPICFPVTIRMHTHTHTLNIYHISGFDVDMDSNCMTIKGVQLADILNEYSIDEIVDALCAAGKDAEVISELSKLEEEE